MCACMCTPVFNFFTRGFFFSLNSWLPLSRVYNFSGKI